MLPLLAALYLVSSLDRANIGNAKIEGLATDLKLSGVEYNTALAVFFISYILFSGCPHTPVASLPNSKLTYLFRHAEQRHPQADQAAIMVPRRERHRVWLHHVHARRGPELHRAGSVPLLAGSLRVSLAPRESRRLQNSTRVPPSAKLRTIGPASSQLQPTLPRRTTYRVSFQSASAPSTAPAPYPAPSRAFWLPPSHRWTAWVAMKDGDGYSSSRG